MIAIYCNSAITAVSSKFEFARLPVPSGKAICGQLSLPIPDEFEDRVLDHVHIALSEAYAVVALSWDVAFYVFELTQGRVQPCKPAAS